MRIAVISDIHGNFVALDAVLDDLSMDHYDELICLGDVAMNGPRPRLCLHRIRDIGCPVIMGNADARVIGQEPPYTSEPGADHPVFMIFAWCVEQLSVSDRDFIATFRSTIEMPLDETSSILFFHGSPRHHSDYIVSTTDEDDLSDMLGGTTATVLIGGHTHLQMLRRKGGRTIVNVGAVGRPLLRDPLDALDSFIVAPWAEYAMIEAENGRLSVDFRRIPIDLTMLEQDSVESGMPDAEWWLSEISRSPTEPTR